VRISTSAELQTPPLMHASQPAPAYLKPPVCTFWRPLPTFTYALPVKSVRDQQKETPQNALLKATAAVPARGPDGQLDVKALPRAAAVAEEKPGNALARCVSSAAAARVTGAARVTTATIAPKLEITAAKRGRKFKEGDEEWASYGVTWKVVAVASAETLPQPPALLHFFFAAAE
jgi:hypothetical protein